MYKGIFFSITN